MHGTHSDCRKEFQRGTPAPAAPLRRLDWYLQHRTALLAVMKFCRTLLRKFQQRCCAGVAACAMWMHIQLGSKQQNWWVLPQVQPTNCGITMLLSSTLVLTGGAPLLTSPTTCPCRHQLPRSRPTPPCLPVLAVASGIQQRERNWAGVMGAEAPVLPRTRFFIFGHFFWKVRFGLLLSTLLLMSVLLPLSTLLGMVLLGMLRQPHAACHRRMHACP